MKDAIDTIKEVKEILATPKNIVITTHKSPDGDAMGSSLALYNFLIQNHHTVTVITPNAWPSFLAWLPGTDKVIDAKAQEKQALQLIHDAEIIFCLDYNTLSRIDQLEKPVMEKQCYKILIDHHLEPQDFANFTMSNTNSSSTCEMIYDFIELLGEKNLINKEVGMCIYTGILTDTASFKFDRTSARTHNIAAEIIDTGVDTTQIHRNIYDTNTEDRLKLVGYCQSEKLVFMKDLPVAYLALTEEELKRFNYKTGDTEGVVNIGLSVDRIQLSAFFTERDGKVKMSFRSKGGFDVNVFARKYFNGGGHAAAAGGDSKEPLQVNVDKFIKVIHEYKNELTK